MKFTLSREWKTFSCSNTSKNAVQIYRYKEQFLSFCRVCPFGLPRCSDRRFFSGKWCKDNSFSHPLQIFRKIFSNELFREPRCLSEYVSFSDCGCKDKVNFSPSPNIFTIIFQLFSSIHTKSMIGKMLEGELFSG